MALPKGFIDLAAAYNAGNGAFVNILGLVVDLMPPVPTKTGQYMFTFKLLDQRLRDSAYGSQGLIVRFFKADLRHLPPVRNIGDVVLLRQMRMMLFNGQPVAVSNFQTNVLTFPAGSIPDPSYSIAFLGNNRLNALGVPADVEKITLEEQAYVIRLKAKMSSTVADIPTPAIVDQSKKRDIAPLPNAGPPEKKARQSSFGPKFMLVEELQHFKFADICAQVVKKYSNQFGSCELYVTDYTANKEMFYYVPPDEETDRERDGDAFGYHQPLKKSWPGPYGWLVLRVNVKEPHAHYINNKVSEGDFIVLRNVKMKITPDGSKLEGDMWPDSINPDKIQVLKLQNQSMHSSSVPEVKELLARKEKYWASRKAKEPQQQDGQQKVTKTEKRRQKKQRQKERAVAAAGAKMAESPHEGETMKRGNGTNKHIRCSNEEVPLTGVRDILDLDRVRHTARLDGRAQILPFINAKYRTRVRVIDFEPKALEDFAVPALPDEDVEMSPIDVAWEASPRHEWFFSLLLEDAGPQGTGAGAEKERMWVQLGQEEAQYLLGNDMDDPQDLRSNPQLLAKLREKLCILWGDLEEKDDLAPLSNRSFECCVMEYGVEMDDGDPEKKLVPFGYKKLFRMFGTTIL